MYFQEHYNYAHSANIIPCVPGNTFLFLCVILNPALNVQGHMTFCTFRFYIFLTNSISALCFTHYYIVVHSVIPHKFKCSKWYRSSWHFRGFQKCTYNLSESQVRWFCGFACTVAIHSLLKHSKETWTGDSTMHAFGMILCIFLWTDQIDLPHPFLYYTAVWSLAELIPQILFSVLTNAICARGLMVCT